MSPPSPPAPTTPGSSPDITGRIERLPISRWHAKSRVLIGTATFFDAFDALTIAQVLPVLVPLWGLTTGDVGLLIAIGYLGQLLGALIFASVAERFGRVPAMILAIIVFSTMSVLCMFSWNFHSLLIFRAIQGLGLGGQVPIAAVYISEITKAHGRGRFVLLYELIFSVGVFVAGIVGYWMVPALGWEYMFLVGAAPILIVYTLRTWLPESPRWLASKGRHEDADRSMRSIEEQVRKAVGTDLPPVQPGASAAEERQSDWRELFKPPYLRRTLVVWCIWFGSYLVYYGISTWLPTLYRTTFDLPLEVALRYGLISTAVGFVGAALCALTIDYLGRKMWFTLALGGSAAFLAVLAISGADTPQKLLIFGSGAYFFATAAAIGVYLYTPELYPTRTRAIGVGTATAWLRLASMAGPLIIGTLIGHGLSLVFVVFGVIAILAALVVGFFAVETKGRVLEELSP
ncbi:MFS transporter [Rhodococcus qingshengii]|uniref:MFS transporter n=1 Tax=Rhodococcus qingshengii TaxID=334542 RepID=UPI0018D49982|nr:MFS transporter [Rhodococcus qingshengii]